MKHRIVTSTLLVLLTIGMSSAMASTADDDAEALIAIAEAVVQLGKDRAKLPDAPPRATGPGDSQGSVSDTPAPPDEDLETDRKDAVDNNPAAETAGEPISALEAEPAKSLPVIEKTPPIPLGPVLPEGFVAPKNPSRPLRLQVSNLMQGVSASQTRAPVEVEVCVGPNCPWCRVMERNGEGDDRIHFTYVNKPPPAVDIGQGVLVVPAIPCSFWVNASGKTICEEGHRTTDQLWEVINRPKNEPPVMQGYATGAMGGSIQGSDKILTMLNFWRTKIGPGVICRYNWTRSGQQSLNLLHAKDWSVRDMFGVQGRMMVSAKGAIALPVDTLGFAYSIDMNGVPTFDVDPISIPSLASLMIKSDSMQGDPMGFFVVDDILLAWNVFSLIKGVYAILWPEVDLVMPPSIDSTAVLADDKLTITFSSGPTVRIVTLFTWTLGVSKVEISEHLVRVHFTGSRLIHYRDFEVE